MSENELNFLKENYKQNDSKVTQKVAKKYSQNDFEKISLTSSSKEILQQKVNKVDNDSLLYRSKKFFDNFSKLCN
jgi:hypothetical protein